MRFWACQEILSLTARLGFNRYHYKERSAFFVSRPSRPRFEVIPEGKMPSGRAGETPATLSFVVVLFNRLCRITKGHLSADREPSRGKGCAKVGAARLSSRNRGNDFRAEDRALVAVQKPEPLGQAVPVEPRKSCGADLAAKGELVSALGLTAACDTGAFAASSVGWAVPTAWASSIVDVPEATGSSLVPLRLPNDWP